MPLDMAALTINALATVSSHWHAEAISARLQRSAINVHTSDSVNIFHLPHYKISGGEYVVYDYSRSDTSPLRATAKDNNKKCNKATKKVNYYVHGPIPVSSSRWVKILHHAREQCPHSRITPQAVMILHLDLSEQRAQGFITATP